MGALTGLSSRGIVYPLDVIKKRLQIQGFESHHQTFGKHFMCDGVVHCITSTVKREGVLSLYKGMAPSIWKGMVTTALNFGIYDVIKKFLINL